ncbi:hypothetical protein [Lentibacillus cibarius]|uniref:DUF4179 domain-containing protein n=1 Tax=Lentibacillus cibarius TaxID=2583219 RepID=A0A5S3QMC7_9BACI|nr:hypothetical protein [Lentibacillus cibarius]TMN22939.1 hypothetical protein FFL34_13215 [Lentibacillus cibarius]
MNNQVKRELDKIEIPDEVHERAKLGVKKAKAEFGSNKKKSGKKSIVYKRLSIVAVSFLLVASIFMFTPALAAVQEVYDKIFSSQHIDDAGVRKALTSGEGQALEQTYYDEARDITVNYETVLTDDKETKLLLTFQSDSTNLENYYIDLFEGVSSISLITENGEKKALDNVGWGSRYYNSEANQVAEALSFESIKKYEGQNIRLEIENLTLYEDNEKGKVETVWPLELNLEQSAISDRKVVEVNKEFTFNDITYTIRRVAFSALETRVVIAGSDTKVLTDENGMKYEVMSELEKQFLHAREISEEYGYTFNEEKSGVYIKSAGEQIVPVFSKGEVMAGEDEYVMTFAPVEDREDCILVVEENIEVPLTK